MATYRTSDGETLDLICWKYYGRQPGAVEVVLEANRHLADLGPIFEAGVMIELPALPAPAPKVEIELWD
tara:strand:- start:40238 stop:40444 length:207 start_codon:yes stop_codon:yes gene_type:complete